MPILVLCTLGTRGHEMQVMFLKAKPNASSKVPASHRDAPCPRPDLTRTARHVMAVGHTQIPSLCLGSDVVVELSGIVAFMSKEFC